MKRGKQRYITIPSAGTDLPSGAGAPGMADEALPPHGVQKAAEVSYRLEGLADELQPGKGNGFPEKPRVLIIAHDLNAKRTAKSCSIAGLDPVVAYTHDQEASQYVREAKETICLAEAFSSHVFNNSYTVLKAADECGAHAILLVDSELGFDESFLGRAHQKDLPVFRALDGSYPQAGWLICKADHIDQVEPAWRKCPHCGLMFDVKGLSTSHYVCPACKSYFRMSSLERIDDVLDAGSFTEWNWPVEQKNPLDFPEYLEKLDEVRERVGADEAVRCGSGSIAGIPLALCIMESQFLMGSMGSVVGEKITRTVEEATANELPLVIWTASGGARMQEGIHSLMQMAKVSCALERHGKAGLLSITVITDPTTGGVTASFAMQADIVLAEPEALIGFAGKRVIQDTIKRALPEGFQTAEFALEHGLIDAIVGRDEQRETLAHLLAIHSVTSNRGKIEEGALISYTAVCESLDNRYGTYNTVAYGVIPQIKSLFITGSQKGRVPAANKRRQTKRLARQSRRLKGDEMRLRAFYGEPTVAEEDLLGADADGLGQDNDNKAWESVKLARNTKRPTAQYYIGSLVKGFIELHGDRSFGDDAAIVCGVGWIGGHPVTVVAQEKGADLNERIARNFGCPLPEGYRKTLRIMRQAEKFGRAIVCLVDTQGAHCDMAAEERGQGNAIAENLIAMAGLEVPVISVVLGEGGSGGALALALSDRVAIQENAVYSVLSPEGFASILWKDASRAAEAAAAMKMSAQEAFDMGIVDAVISEGEGAAHENPETASACLKSYLINNLDELSGLTPDQLLEGRYRRFRKY